MAQVDPWWMLVPSFMADGGNASWVGCILLKDIVGDKEGHSSYLGLVQTPPATVNIQRGELLLPCHQKEESSLQNHHKPSQFKLACKLCRDSNITVQCRPDEVAWLNLAEFEILEAVQSPQDRYEEFCMDRKLIWASKLKLGSVVHVRLAGETRTVVQYAEGIVRYIGKLGKNPGQIFGVEITESKFRGLGSSNGRYHQIRLFPCDNRCGEFVAVDKLSRMKTEHKRKFPALNPSHSSDLSDSLETREASLGERVVVYSRMNLPIHGTVRWRGRHWSQGDIVGIETDILVSRGDFSDAIPGLADEFPIDPDHGRVVLPENLILKETQHRRRSLSPARGRSLSPTRDKERSPSTKSGIAAKHCHEETRTLQSAGSGPLHDIPLHQLRDAVQSHDPLVALNQELERELRSQEQLNRQQQEQIARLRIELTKMAANVNETEQKLAVTEQQLAEQQAESDQLKQTLSRIEDENVELGRRVAGQAETLGQLWQRNAQLEDQLMNTAASDPIHFWEVSREEVEVLPTILGSGAWGWVSKAIFRGKVVAVKCLHKEILCQFTIDQIRREVNIMAQVRHPNLVLFIAAVLDSKEGPLIITEILHTSLRKAAYQNILGGNSVKLSVFQDVAAALNYLHQHREPIIHRDVSSGNVLLELLPQDMWRAKLSDFGSANLVRFSTTPGPGAIVYAAPEASLGPQTPKMDVYSFGVLICEIVTGEFPSDSSLHRMLLSVKQTWPSIHRLTKECVERKELERPTMNTVLQNLKTVHIDP